MKPDDRAYFQSLSDELTTQSKRVRHLIGGSHWGHDGRHKELLLQNLIRRYCPGNSIVSTGFIISSTDQDIRSKEQDVLVVDTSIEAPLFHQGDLVIVYPHTVIAAISVKSNMTDESIGDVIDGLATVRAVSSDCNIVSSEIWCGGFFYNIDDNYSSDKSKVYDSIAKHIRATPGKRPLLQETPYFMGPDVIVEARNYTFLFDYEKKEGIDSARVRGYDCAGIATAIFLGALVQHISTRFGRHQSTFSDTLGELKIQQLNPSRHLIC
jgi:hypothetical protein